MSETFPDLLRRLRSERGWSQPQLARYSGVSQAAIGMLETGKRTRPAAETLLRLAKALEVSVDMLASAAETKE